MTVAYEPQEFKAQPTIKKHYFFDLEDYIAG